MLSKVHDLAASKVVRRYESAHDRPVHTLVHSADVSAYVSHPRQSYELFASSATDGNIRLWDLRASGSVRCLSGHCNNYATVGMSFSPCMRYLATGSEDKLS